MKFINTNENPRVTVKGALYPPISKKVWGIKKTFKSSRPRQITRCDSTETMDSSADISPRSRLQNWFKMNNQDQRGKQSLGAISSRKQTRLSDWLLLNVWKYCSTQTLLTKLNRLSKGTRAKITGSGAEGTGIAGERAIIIDLQTLVDSEKTLEFSYFAQCVIEKIDFKFKMEPAIRKRHYDEKLKEGWTDVYGEDWDVTLYDYWVRQLLIFRTGVTSLSQTAKFAHGKITIQEIVVNMLPYTEIEPVFVEHPHVVIKEMEVAGDVSSSFFANAVDHCESFNLWEGQVGERGDIVEFSSDHTLKNLNLSDVKFKCALAGQKLKLSALEVHNTEVNMEQICPESLTSLGVPDAFNILRDYGKKMVNLRHLKLAIDVLKERNCLNQFWALLPNSRQLEYVALYAENDHSIEHLTSQEFTKHFIETRVVLSKGGEFQNKSRIFNDIGPKNEDFDVVDGLNDMYCVTDTTTGNQILIRREFDTYEFFHYMGF